MNWVIIGSCNGLTPFRRQAITWTNDDLNVVKPLLEPMMTYSQLGPPNKLQWNFNQDAMYIIQENAYENIVCKDFGHFVEASMVI